MSALLLQIPAACSRNDKTPDLPSAEQAQVERGFLQLQKELQELRPRMVKLQQENEAFKAGSASVAMHDKDVENRLSQTQIKLNNLQHEYQTLQQDYSDLEKSISPLVSRLQASVAAHRKELIGTDLGTITLKSGRQLRQSKVTGITDQALRLKFSEGWLNVPYADLPSPIQQRFFFETILVPSEALLSKTPDTQQTDPLPKPKTNDSSPMEEAFAEQHRRELKQYQLSIQPKIISLNKKTSLAKKQITNLKRERIKTSQTFSRRSGSIKRSSADLDKALNKIDSEIHRLSLAITVAEGQIKGWKKELIRNESGDK